MWRGKAVVFSIIMLALAPDSSKSFTQSICPACAATKRGVQPSSLGMLTIDAISGAEKNKKITIKECGTLKRQSQT